MTTVDEAKASVVRQLRELDLREGGSRPNEHYFNRELCKIRFLAEIFDRNQNLFIFH